MNLWRWEISNVKGVKVSSSEAAFLSEKGCREQCELMKGVLEKEESQKYEVSVHSTEIFMPDAKRLATKIYNYILRLELTERVKKYCTGCSYGAFEPTEPCRWVSRGQETYRRQICQNVSCSHISYEIVGGLSSYG